MTYSHLFEPIDVGTMRLRNRVMLPPHASAIGNIWGTEDEARRNIAYFERRCSNEGVAWVGSLSTHLRNTVVPGFEPTGVGAATLGHFRLPYFVERVQQFTDSIHALGTAVTVQMVHQGGMPHAPSAVMSAPTINLVPHVMTEDEIAWFVREYADSARLAQEGRADGVELHLNHEDLHECFLSPYTNQRTDTYGGSAREPGQVRGRVPARDPRRRRRHDDVGIRLNIREELPEGYDVAGGIELAQYFESTGLIDYVHGVIGSPWGNPSYIQPTQFEPGSFAPYAGELKRALSRRSCTPGGSHTRTWPSRSWPRGTRISSGWRGRTSRTETSSPRRGPGGPTRSGRVSAGTSASAGGTSRGCRSAVP